MTETSCAVSAAAQLSPAVDFADLDGNLLISNDRFRGVTVSDGRLILPEGTKVQFRESDGSDGDYILLEVKAEQGKTLVKYLGVSDSEPMEDFARDLSDEDIREVLRAIGHPAKNV